MVRDYWLTEIFAPHCSSGGIIASRIIDGPSDNGDVVMGNFERWPFDDLDVLGSRRRRRILSGDGDAKEQAARCSGGPPYYEQSIHPTGPSITMQNRYRGRTGPTHIPGPMGSALVPAAAGRRRYPSRRGIE